VVLIIFVPREKGIAGRTPKLVGQDVMAKDQGVLVRIDAHLFATYSVQCSC